jgi:HlyD family secretion protein
MEPARPVRPPELKISSVTPRPLSLPAPVGRSGRKPASHNRTWVKIGAPILLALAAFFVIRGFTSGDPAAMLTATAKRGRFDVVVVETGELQAEHSRSVSAPMMASGRMQLAIQYLAPEGTRVDSGALLISFDQADQLKTISDKTNDLKSAEADLDKLKAQQKSDKEDAEMANENAKLGYDLAKLSDDNMKFESKAQQDESKLNLKKAELAYTQTKDNLKGKSQVRKSDLASSNLKIAQIESSLNQAKSDLEKLTVRAPAAGLIVYQHNWNTGKKFTRGDQPWAGQSVMILPDLSQMQAVLEVNEVDISKVKPDQVAEVRLDAFPDRKFTGKIMNVASIGNPKETNPSVKVFEVLVNLDQADSILRPGMTVSARIMVSTIENVVSVPIEAVFDDGGKPVVYVQHGSSFDKRAVTLGERNDNFIIIAKGLKEGEKVSLTDPDKSAEPEEKPKKDAAQSKAS